MKKGTDPEAPAAVPAAGPIAGPAAPPVALPCLPFLGPENASRMVPLVAVVTEAGRAVGRKGAGARLRRRSPVGPGAPDA
ncbi:hypothetical protein GCM10010383_34080 [Streptomyces lomondensis]|uniref:Uncharacterized protein n=1 Tax=Streptomyces lomondensis TaxID=68229 RepID=A0ABQ2X664_9ACTN|nr:hypothetical protein GCM10010383_34080 [Streptomyces lomondensis]